MRARIFIASSHEGRGLAYAIQSLLEHDVSCVVWDQGIFQLSSTVLQDLMKSLESFDFGIFVFSPDDSVSIRGEDYQATRDNVLFEFGLFTGRLGASRAFIVAPKTADLRIPTDLLGITLATYVTEALSSNSKIALGPVCHEISEQIKTSFFPRPGLYLDDNYSHGIGDGWRLYTGTAATFSCNAERVRLGETSDTGFEYPNFGISQKLRYVLFRVRRPSSRTPVIVYLAFEDLGALFHVVGSTTLRRFGWGIPTNEFGIPLWTVPEDDWYPIILDISNIHNAINRPGAIISFKVRAPLSLSHIWCADRLDQIPETIRRWGTRLVEPIAIPTTLPIIEILTPQNGYRVGHKHVVQGVLVDPGLHVASYVYFPDRRWYRQGNAALRENSRNRQLAET